MGAGGRSETEKREAVDAAVARGYKAAAGLFGVSQRTVRRWAAEQGRTDERLDGAAHAAEVNENLARARHGRLAAARLELAEALLGDALRMRAQFWEATVEQKIMVVSDGAQLGSHWEVARLERPVPTFAEQREIAAAISDLAKTSQLLAGEATARTEAVTPLDAELDRLAAELAGVHPH